MILIIEDNQTIAENISEYLELQGIETKVFFDGESAFEHITDSVGNKRNFPQGIVLDRMMPKLDGLSLARMLKNRGYSIPIIFLTALDKPVDRLEGLEVGAIDYLSKPVELKELALKIKNLLSLSIGGKTSQLSTKSEKIHSVITPDEHSGKGEGSNNGELPKHSTGNNPVNSWEIQIDTNIVLDIGGKRVIMDGIPVSLSPKEYTLLELLANHQGQVITYDTILEKVWHESPDRIEEFQSSITVHVAYLRKKLQTNLLRTVKLTGYVLDFPNT